MKIRKICKFVFIGVLSLVLLLNMVRLFKRVVLREQIPMLLGYGNAAVVSGSMEPAIVVGDMIIIHRQSDYEVGDIVTYRGTHTSVTHRITEKTAGGYITKGDANNADDVEIERSLIIGKVVKIVPNAGDVFFFLQSPLGTLIVFVVFILLIGLLFLIERLKKKPNE